MSEIPVPFLVVRDQDVTGVSGTGVVAEGVRFTDGTAAVRWRVVSNFHAERGVKPTTVVHPDIQSVIALHGHNGATHLEWPLGEDGDG